jgi:hypothetical protein
VALDVLPVLQNYQKCVWLSVFPCASEEGRVDELQQLVASGVVNSLKVGQTTLAAVSATHRQCFDTHRLTPAHETGLVFAEQGRVQPLPASWAC